MNHTYRLVWNEAGQCQSPAPETARGRGKHSSVKPLAAVLLAIFTCNAHALPTGAQIAAGQVGIAAAGKQMTLDQASKAAIVNWQSFNVARDEALRIRQGGADAAMLARVVGNAGSEIFGRIQADGRLYLINQRGVIIGKDAVIDTAAFMATTRNISDADFLRGGTFTFSGDSMAGIENLGTVRAAEGNVMLFAHTVSNSGILQAPKGAVNLAAGNELLLAAPGVPDFLVRTTLPATTAAATGIDNSGLIEAAQAQLKAAGGSVYELAINQSGTIRATGVEERDGRVILTADGGAVLVSGTVSARKAGGSGGEILVGGDMHGANPGVANAARTAVTETAVLDASSTAADGSGGKVVVWADGNTWYSGAMTARGGEQGGNGGNAEVSGKGNLVFSGSADLRAPNGKQGTLLLDPTTIDIVAGAAGANPGGMTTSGSAHTWPFAADAGAQTITNGTVNALLGTGNLDLQANNSLTVSAAISSSAANSLKLWAPTITANAGISLPNGVLYFMAPSAGGSLTSAAGAAINVNQVNIDGSYATVTLGGAVTAATLTFEKVIGGATSLNITNSANNISGLQFIGTLNSLTSAAVASSSAMSVSGQATTTGAITLTSGGNLTMLNTALLTAGGTATLASTGGAFINQAGTGLLAGAGRKLIYTATEGGGFTAGGLGYAQTYSVSYANDPQGAGNVIYIASAAPMPTMTITANSLSRFYGQSDPVFTAALNGGTAAALTAPVLFQIVEPSHLNVGIYTIMPYGASSSAYQLNYVNGTLTVNPAPLQIIVNNASKTYGAANPALSVQYSGLANGDGSGIVSGLGLSTAATTGSPVGSYAIVPSGASVAVPYGGTVPNYTISYVNGALTINPAPLTVTAPNLSRLYGAANTGLSAQYSGFVNGETAAAALMPDSLFLPQVTLSTAATAASPVGAYAIIPSGLRQTGANYTPVYVNGTLTINKAPLNISINDATRGEFTANPLLTAQFDGLRNGDTRSMIDIYFTTSALTNSPSGAYPIWSIDGANPGMANNKTANYTLRITREGTLSVVKDLPTFVVKSDRLDMQPITNKVDGTIDLEKQKKEREQIAKDIEKDKENQNIYLSGPGTGLPLTIPSSSLQNFIDAMAAAGVTVTKGQVYEALADPNLRNEMLGTLLPFVYRDLGEILALDESKWTPQQKAFVAAMQDYIQKQKKAAAAKGLADYVAWQNEQDRKRAETFKRHGGEAGNPGAIQMDTDASSSPELPPGDFLALAQGGLWLTEDQTASYLSMTDQVASIGKQTGAPSPASLAGARVAAGWAADQVRNSKDYTEEQKKGILFQLQDRTQWLDSDDPQKRAQAIDDLARSYAALGGPRITEQQIADQLSATPILRFGAGALADIGGIIHNGISLSKYGPTSNDLLKIPGMSKVFSQTAKTVARAETAGVKYLRMGMDGLGETAEVLQVVSKVSKFTKIARGIGKVLGPAALATELVGNTVQAGLGIVMYANIGEYEKQLDTARGNANKQVSVNDLKAMMDDGSAFNYLTVMTATNGGVAALTPWVPGTVTVATAAERAAGK